MKYVVEYISYFIASYIPFSPQFTVIKTKKINGHI